jgi:hypothetical protein
MASNTPFIYKSFPVCPGAYLINSGYGMYPIFYSISNFDTLCSMNDQDNFFIVMPGYKLLTYPSSNYGTDSTTHNGTYDNTNGTTALYYPVVTTNGDSYADHTTSCYLYYKNNLIT